MARFGQGFIQALTNPSYQQGLFTAAQGVGAAPGVAVAEQKQKEQESELMNYVSALSQKTMPPAGMAAQRESLLKSGISLEKILSAENLGAKQRDQGIARLEARQVSINAQAKEARRKQLEVNAVNKATALNRPNDAAALAGADEATLRSYLMQRPEEKEGFTLTPGSTRFDAEGNKIASVGFNDDTAIDDPFELVKGGKYTPQSIQDSILSDGSLDYSALVRVSDTQSAPKGQVPANVEKRIGDINVEATKAAIALGRNRELQQRLISSPGKSTGIISDLRTSALNLAGLRDEEEEVKTQFLRNRNTDIINSLPPGVASDTDIRIFSQGFPKENAGSEEITAYLQAEERILAASSDMALVADRYLSKQVNEGRDASFIGYEDQRQGYAQIMSDMSQRIASRIANGEDPLQVEREEVNSVSQVLGFTPKFYR